MNVFTSIVTGPVVQAIGWALLHLVWQATLVAAILAAALALLQRRSANLRYLVSCGALLLVVALGVVTAVRAYQPRTAVSAESILAGVSAGVSSSPVRAVEAAAVPIAQQTGISWLEFTASHLPQLVGLWFLGVLILSLRLMTGWVAAHRLATHGARTASREWEESLMAIARAIDLRRPILLLESAAVEVPTVIGWLRPVILLPVATLSGLTVQQIEMILAHELAHIRRHDFLVNLMQSAIETLFFYHPAVWWISRRMRVEREHCCDDHAVAVFGDPVQYARALTRFEELRGGPRSALAANGGSLLDRIRRLVLVRAETSQWPSRWAAGAALLTVITAVFFAPSLPLFASHDGQPAPPAAVRAATPAPADAPKAKTNAKTSVRCATAPVAPSAEVDVEAPEVMAPEPPMVAIAPSIPLVNVRPMIAPAIRESVALAQAIAGGVSGGIDTGVLSGIKDGVIGGIDTDLADVRELKAKLATIKASRHRIGEGGKLSVDDLIALSSAGVTPKYIDEMRRAGLGDISLDDVVALRMQGVSPAFVSALRDAGVRVDSARDAISLRMQGVTGDYVKEMVAAGYANLGVRELIELRMSDVSPAFVKSLSEAGYTHLSVKDLLRLRMSGVDANFIRELSKYRTQ